MRLSCQESTAISDCARTSINALNICFVHSSLDSNAHKLRSRTCRGVAGKDTWCLSSSNAGVFSASQSQTDASLLSASDVQGRKGDLRCSAIPESNGVWTTNDNSARPDYSPDRRWSGRDSWSVHKPLQVPLEDAIRHGNWLEARSLVDKLLSVGTVQDGPCQRLVQCNRSRQVPCMTCSKPDWRMICRSLYIWPFPDRLAAVQVLCGHLPSTGVLNIPNNDSVCLQGDRIRHAFP